MTRTHRRLIALLGVVLAALFAVGVSASIRASIWRERPGTATGMMSGYSVPGDGRQVDSLVTARQRAQLMADRLGLRTGEVIQFSNGFYAELVDSNGKGAVEVLVDPVNGAVRIGGGPAIMWNTRFGMHYAWAGAPVVSAADAQRRAQQWLDDQRPALAVEASRPFPGYYTLQTTRDGELVGMISVNAVTGSVWYHTWHGSFVRLSEE